MQKTELSNLNNQGASVLFWKSLEALFFSFCFILSIYKPFLRDLNIFVVAFVACITASGIFVMIFRYAHSLYVHFAMILFFVGVLIVFPLYLDWLLRTFA